MPYESKANSLTPQLIIMLLDVSGSMGNKFGSDTRISAVTKTFRDIVQRTLNQSIKDQRARTR